MRNLLSPSMEDAVLGVICAFHSLDTPLDLPRVRKFLCGYVGADVSESYTRNFLLKHRKDIRLGERSVLSKTRIDGTVAAQAGEFNRQFSGMRACRNFNLFNSFVCDETRIGRNPSGNLVVLDTLLCHRNDVQPRGESLATLIPFTNFIGETPFLVLIYKHEGAPGSKQTVHVPIGREGLRRSRHIMRLTSDTGYLTRELWADIMREFRAWWNSFHPGLELYLLFDNLGSHLDEDLIMKEMENLFYMWTIMKNTSHWFQVHDQYVFAVLKRVLARLLGEIDWTSDITTETRKALASACLFKAIDEALKPETVLKSFEKTGMEPYDPVKIQNMANERSHLAAPKGHRQSVEETLRAVQTYLVGQKEVKESLLSSVTTGAFTNDDAFTFSPESRLEAMREREAKAAEETAEKARKAAEKESRKAEVEKQRQEGEANKLANTCYVEECGKICRGGQAWGECAGCHKKFCPTHKKNIPQHVESANCGLPKKRISRQVSGEKRKV